MRAPAGYVPEEIAARPEKRWQQGQAADFDTLDSGKLDKFRLRDHHRRPPTPRRRRRTSSRCCARATTCSGSATGETPRSRVVEGEDGEIGALLDCDASSAEREGVATVVTGGELVPYTDWRLPERGRARRRRPGARLRRPRRGHGGASRWPQSGRYALSLQYHSQVPLEVLVDGEVGRRAAAVARRHVPRRGRPRGVLARRRGRSRRSGRHRGHGPRRRAERAPGRARGRAPGLARRPRRHPRRPPRGRDVASPTPATATSTTSPSTAAGADEQGLPQPGRGALAGARRRRDRARAGARAGSSSSAAPGAAAPTCSRSCSRATRASGSSRSRSASTPTPTASPACSPAR